MPATNSLTPRSTDDRLLTEIERQTKYLNELPEDFEFPLFNTARAIESQRQSGYRTTASAAREIVDNAIEAGATKVHVVFDYPKTREAHQRRDVVSAVAFIDNGAGMLPKMARYALSWGGGTHFDDPHFIGKFGFGLPNASINQTRRVDVYTRTQGVPQFTKACLDINSVRDFAVQKIPEPSTSKLPDFVQDYIKREGVDLSQGTVVVWDKPDRLSRRTGASLREHLVDDFSVTYRYLLKERELKVDGTIVRAVDPLFLDPGARYYLEASTDADSVDRGGAQLKTEEAIPVKYVLDPATGGKHLRRIHKTEDLVDDSLIEHGIIRVRVARLPLGFAVSRKGKHDIKPMDDHSFARFEIRKPRRGMSFVRAKREVETVDVFPQRGREESSGMGEWPLLQGYAYHWGVEVQFEPNLDEVFGISNDKQTVRPIEDFWRVLAEVGIDDLLRRENRWQELHRKKEEKSRRAALLEQPNDLPTPAELSAQAGDVALGDKPEVPESMRRVAQENFNKRVRETAQVTGEPENKVEEFFKEQAKRQAYRVDFVDADHGYIYVPKWDGMQIVVQVNKRHSLFDVLYGSLLQVPGGGLARQAVDLMLITLAKSELSKNEDTNEVFRAQRESVWSPFLATALRDLSRRFDGSQTEEEVEGE